MPTLPPTFLRTTLYTNEVRGNVIVNGNFYTSSNVRATYFIGNGAFITGVTASLPSEFAADVFGNVTGSYINVNNATATYFTGNYSTLSGNSSASYFIGNGALLTGIERYVLPSEITADVLGNVTAAGNVSASYFFGNGYNLILDGYTLKPAGNVANAAVRLALPAQIGTIVHQDDIDQEYMLLDTPASVDSNWLEFTGENYPVTSVFGRTGAISLISGIDVNTIGGTSIVGNGDITSLSVDVLGNVTATGNVSAEYFLGDGSLLSGIVSLDQDGKIPQNELNGYLVVPQGYVANTAVRLALGGGDLPVGSLARQVDNGNSYMLTMTPSNVDSNWIVFDGLNFPITTVFGRVGDILSTFGDYSDDYIELTSNVGPIGAGNSVAAALQYMMGQITAIQAFISTPAAPFDG